MRFSDHSRIVAAVIGALAISTGASAQTPTEMGPYLSLGGGVNSIEPNTTVAITGNPITQPTLPAKLSFKSGYDITAAAGYKWVNGLRAEVELGWRSNKIDRVNSIPWSGRQQVFGVMGNVLYDFKTSSRVTPYIGIGGGAARDRFSNVTGFTSNVTPSAVFSGHDTNFQWQAIGGVNMPVSNRLSVFADYRYIVLNNNDIRSRSNPNARILGYDNRSHNFLIGIRFALGKGEEPAPKQAAAPPPPPPRAPPPPPPAPPPQPKAPEKILAFFDFDKANLRPDAKEIVAQAVQQFRSGNKTVIHLTGHTDTSGTDQYNMALSKRRANAVKAELVRLGIPEREITVAWKGEAEPLVQTGDGVKEPQNRRVEIVYD